MWVPSPTNLIYVYVNISKLEKKIQNPKHFWSLALQEVITQPMLISYKDKRNVSIISIAKGTSGKIMTSYNIV
jgi:hypothetical protein